MILSIWIKEDNKTAITHQQTTLYCQSRSLFSGWARSPTPATFQN